MDPERAALPLRPPDRTPRQTRQSPRPRIEGPGRERQAERLAPAFGRLSQAFEAGRLRVAEAPDALEPEQILVIEIAGEIQDFRKAVQRIGGFEWLAEQAEDDRDPDEEFAAVDRDGTRKRYPGQLFVLASDATAWRELLRLWDIYQQGGTFRRGLTKFRDVFDLLRELRPWDDRDRLERAGAVQAWQLDLAHLDDQLVPFEAELWLRRDPELRGRLRDAIAADIQAAGGELQQELVLEEISYHGLLARVPARLLLEVAALREVRWMRTGGVRLFHAAGQAVAPSSGEFEVFDGAAVDAAWPGEAPVRVAILDGVPMENHDLLAGRLVVDDPEGWAAEVPASRRVHGTAMSSLAIHGDLSDPHAPPTEPVYIRPILRYEAPAWVQTAREEMPADRLVVDLIHAAVTRILDGDAAVAPHVRVISLSVADASQPYDRFVSPWARLLDWLSFRYRVLFLVSAGNQVASLRVPAELALDDPDEVEAAVLDAVRQDALSRRLFAPAESINALTIGAAHDDAAGEVPVAPRLDPFVTPGLASVVSPTSSGFRRSIKPEILLPGGRQLVQAAPLAVDGEVLLDVRPSSRAPGVLTAAPDPAGSSMRTVYTCGTSAATALAARGALTLLERLDWLREAWGVQFPGSQYDAVLLKALLAHTATWGEARDAVAAVLAAAGEPSGRASIARFLGYGAARPYQSLVIDGDTRVTALYAEEILEGDAHHYVFPLPPSLAASTIERRLTFTLAWLSPVNPRHRNYRRGALSVEPGNPSKFFGSREEADANAARRGTLQHETLRGHRAVPFVDGDNVTFVVSCRKDAGMLEEPVPYAFVVTLEVPIQAELPIYSEVRERLLVRVPVRPRR